MLKNIEHKDAKIYLDKFYEQINRSSTENIFMKQLINSGIECFTNPYNVSWEITAACNLRCKHCCFSNQDYNADNDVSTEVALRFVNELVDSDLVKIMITGGEPFLRKDLFKIIEILKTKNTIIELTTNAIVINEDIVQNLVKHFNLKFDYIQVSLDGADLQTHEQTRGKDSFLKTIKGIKLLIKSGINVTINCVVTKNNYHQMIELYNLAQKLGVSLITFSRIHTEDKNLLPDINLLFKETIKLLKQESKKLPINLRLFTIPELITNDTFKDLFDDDFIKIQNYICHRGEKLHIRKDGEVFLCLYASTKNICSLGNINKDSLQKILKRRKTNPLFKKRILKNTKCNICKAQYYCKAGCPVSAFVKFNNINLPDPNCEII